MSNEEQRTAISQKLSHFSGRGFGDLAMQVFRYQAVHNPVYARYLSLLNIDFRKVEEMNKIPFLPIQFFKNYSIMTGSWDADEVFTSSGTTGATTSRHAVRDPSFYLRNTVNCFRHFYGEPAKYCFLALLPSYLERSGSSLIRMAGHFIRRSNYAESGFFLDNTDELLQTMERLKKRKVPVLLLGVSFALLDLAERHPMDLGNVLIMETGGMKGRRREITRFELHRKLSEAFRTEKIHSEYGMTELFSQAYSSGDGIFYPPPTMRVFPREITDPLTSQAYDRTGVLNIIDLANFDTCSFIATDDLGKVGADGRFEVLGRIDNSDIRGCNLMVYD